MTPLGDSFPTLHPGHLGDFGQDSSLGGYSTAPPGGLCAAGGRVGGWLGHSAEWKERCERVWEKKKQKRTNIGRN